MIVLVSVSTAMVSGDAVDEENCIRRIRSKQNERFKRLYSQDVVISPFIASYWYP
jgi:hypothetical protein